MKQKLRLTKKQGIFWIVGLLASAIVLYEVAEQVFGIRWAEFGREQAGMVCFVLAGLLFAYAIWLVIKAHLKIGEPYDTLRAELKVLRSGFKRIEREGGCSEARFNKSVARFDECAKMLGEKEYKPKRQNKKGRWAMIYMVVGSILILGAIALSFTDLTIWVAFAIALLGAVVFFFGFALMRMRRSKKAK